MKGKLKKIMNLLGKKEGVEYEFSSQISSFFKDKQYWIIGAGTGYGRAIAIALAASDAKVFISGRRESKLLETKKIIESHGINSDLCVPLAMDVIDEESVKRSVDILTSVSGGRLYGMVYTAAIPQGDMLKKRPLHKESIEKWETRFKTNVGGALLCTRHASNLMLDNNSMRIVFLSSAAGWAFTPGYGPYNVSKAALNSLGGALAEEYLTAFPDKLVQINVIDPGEAKTEMNSGSSDSPFNVIDIVGKLLSCPLNGPNGKFFDRYGNPIVFCNSIAYMESL
ncbi:MAG: SDR family oxidoreductase [Desulfobacteraceae bacterium]|nr:SDR family oxidoreductase [Desulfobacteraceae bacterium]